MGWPKCVSVLLCALILPNPICRGGVWTTNDEARALNEGRDRLTDLGGNAKSWTKEDEARAKITGQGRIRHVTPDFGVEVPQFEGRTQDGATVDESRAINQGKGRLSSPVQTTPHVNGKIWTKEDETRAINQGKGRLSSPVQATPHVNGKIWTKEDETRAINQGRGRLSSPVQATPHGKGKIWTKEDETRAKITGQGRIRDGRTQEGAAFDESRFEGRTQGGAAQKPQFVGRTQAELDYLEYLGAEQLEKDANVKDSAAENARFDAQKPQFDGRKQDDGAQKPQFGGRTQAELDYLEYLQAEQLENDANVKDSAAENARFDTQKPQLDGHTQDAGAQKPQFHGRTQAEQDYLEYLRAEQLENDANVKDSTAENARVVSKKPQFNGRTQDAGAQKPQFNGRTQAELDYLEYLRAEQLENDVNVKDSTAENARFDAQKPQFDGHTQDAGAQKPQFGGRTQAELDYLESLRAEHLENDGKIKDSAVENARFGAQNPQFDGRTQAELDYLEYLGAEQLENDAKIKDSAAENARFDPLPQFDGRTQDVGAEKHQFGGRTQAELDYLDYLRAEQLENDAKIKDSAAENARLYDQKPHLEGLMQDAVAEIFQTDGRSQSELDYLEYLRAEQLEIDAMINDAENTRFEEAEITEEPNSDEPFCHSCHLFEKKVEKPVEIQPKTNQPDSECLSCHLFDEPASSRPLPEVDTRKLASDESESGYLSDTLNRITGIYQGEGTGRNLAPVNPRFSVRNQDSNANLEHPAKAAGGGGVWTTNDEARALNEGRGRLIDLGNGKIWTKEDEARAKAELGYFLNRQFLLDRSPPDSSNTRFGGQSEDKSATRFGGQRQGQPASANTRLSGQRQDQPASANTRHSGPRQNQRASANPRFRGQIRDQPASANIRFGGPTQDRPATANTRFRGQKQDQFASSNTRFEGQIQHQPISANTRFEDKSTSGFGDHSDLGGSNRDQPQNIDAELAFEAEAAQLRVAQKAFEAQVGEQQLGAAQKAFEAQVGEQQLPAAQKAFEAQVGEQQQGKLQTFGDGRKIKVSKLMDVDESLEVPRSTIAERIVDNAGRKIIQVSKLMDKDERQETFDIAYTFSGSSLSRPRGCRSCYLLDV